MKPIQNSIHPEKRKGKKSSIHQALYILVIFLAGCFVSSTIIILSLHPSLLSQSHNANLNSVYQREYQHLLTPAQDTTHDSFESTHKDTNKQLTSSTSSSLTSKILNNKRILIAIASFDFSQFPLLEEVLDSYQNLCFSGTSKVDIYIHTTVPYTVALIDMLNTRLNCDTMQIYIVVKSPAVRLNLVDYHRTLFYENIDNYDLFVYSEDDILVTPTTIATYLQETINVQNLLSKSPAQDYNIGIVRYEYNYPPDVIINDKTRHATEKVTRVYWEHLWKPIVPKSVHVPDDILNPSDVPFITKNYVTMDNAHQGMFMATSELLKAWKDRENCNFDVIRQRPGVKGKPSQPAEGTQRVWMSSRMLHGKKHCNVKQLIPIRNFNQLAVWHLPNKNYRRVGKKGRIGGADSDIENEFGTGKEQFVGPDSSLPTAMELHLAMREAFGYPDQSDNALKYNGIKMIDEVDWSRFFKGKPDHQRLVDERMKAYDDYVARGGVMAKTDFQNWQWIVDRVN